MMTAIDTGRQHWQIFKLFVLLYDPCLLGMKHDLDELYTCKKKKKKCNAGCPLYPLVSVR